MSHHQQQYVSSSAGRARAGSGVEAAAEVAKVNLSHSKTAELDSWPAVARTDPS
jgi:hypothetical protein